MASSALQRELYHEKYINFSPADQTNLATTDTVVGQFIAPNNLLLDRIVVGFLTSGGTTPALTIKVKDDAGTVIASTTTDGTAPVTEGCSTAIDAFLPGCRVYQVTMNSFNADNDFTGIGVTVVLEPVQADS